MRLWYWMLLGLNAFDVIFTILVIKYLGFVEMNPLGFETGLIIKIVGLIILWFVTYTKYIEYTVIRFFMKIAVYWYGLWAIIHLYRLLCVI